jgi:Ca2+-binding RTX toxin-like protein
MMRPALAVLALVAASAVIAAPAQAATSCAGHKVTIQGSSGNNTINGTQHADVIDAGAGNDVVNGRGGNDIICGGDGADDLRGNAGNDRLYGNLDRVFLEKVFMDSCNFHPGGYCVFAHFDGDVLRGNAGNDVMVPGYDNRPFSQTQTLRNPDELRWDTSPRGVRVNLTKGTATGEGADGITASGTYRTITSPYADTVVGTDGNDSIQTGAGADTIFARDGYDNVWTGSTGSSADEAHGGPGGDNLTGAGGATRLYGDEGTDNLVDNSTIGADQLRGGPDGDWIKDLIQPVAGQVDDGGGDEGDRFQPTLHVGGAATWNMVSGAMTFSTPSPTTVSAPGFHAFSYSGIFSTVWEVTGTDLADSVGAPGAFHAGGGADRYQGGSGDDTFDGGPGSDIYDSDGGGTNTCTSVEQDSQSFCDTNTP